MHGAKINVNAKTKVENGQAGQSFHSVKNWIDFGLNTANPIRFQWSNWSTENRYCIYTYILLFCLQLLSNVQLNMCQYCLNWPRQLDHTSQSPSVKCQYCPAEFVLIKYLYLYSVQYCSSILFPWLCFALVVNLFFTNASKCKAWLRFDWDNKWFIYHHICSVIKIACIGLPYSRLEVRTCYLAYLPTLPILEGDCRLWPQIYAKLRSITSLLFTILKIWLLH